MIYKTQTVHLHTSSMHGEEMQHRSVAIDNNTTVYLHVTNNIVSGQQCEEKQLSDS